MCICNDKYDSEVTKPQKEGIPAKYRVIDDIDCGKNRESRDSKKALTFPEIVCKIAGNAAEQSGIACHILKREA